MNLVWPAAMILGAAGSAHCAGMCGPIALAVPSMGNSRRARLASTALLNAGRLMTYALLGALFGLFGKGLLLAGLQRTVSVTTGSLLLLAVIAPRPLARVRPDLPLLNVVGRLRGMLARALHRTAPEALLLTGVLNGLLPCGMVYTAAIGAASTTGPASGALFMVLFGAGTLPALVLLRSSRAMLSPAVRTRLRRSSPAIMTLMGVLLIARGLQLNVPFVSPAAPSIPDATSSCSLHL